MTSKNTLPFYHVQVYLVAGGAIDSSTSTASTFTASTEVLVDGAASWTEAAPLPLAIAGLQSVSIDNYIISIGK